MKENEILEEVNKLRVFYKLKTEIRYGLERTEVIETESVAEHVFGMFIMANYFLPLENPNLDWDREKIFDMILYHDIDEIETGDTIGYLKTTEHKSIEIDAVKKVIELLPTSMKESIQNVLSEYSDQNNIESKFVKAVDKFEPLLQLLCDSGLKTSNFQKTTLEQHWMIKTEALKNFPIIMRFAEVITKEMEAKGYFDR
jgi:5'-deoxynucleotidase YfbR-like HD superfamily hydrolase